MKSDHPHDETALAQRHASLSRRHFLRGLGVSTGPARVRFPGLAECRRCGAAEVAGLPATTATGAPLRMAFVYVPNGVNQKCWWPKKEGKDFDLNPTLRAAGAAQEPVPGHLRAGPDQRHRRQGRAGRPCASLRDLPDRPPGQEDRGGRYPRGRLDRPGRGASRSATSPGSPRSSWPATPPGSPGTATPATPAPTSSTCPGRPHPCR